MKQILLEMQNITKTFRENSVKAVNSANLTVSYGEIHSIVGENGAGKSTLMHILAGELNPDNGNIKLKNQNTVFKTSSDAIKNGIAMVHQNLKLIPELSVMENIILGSEPVLGPGTLNKKEAHTRIERLCREFDIYIDPDKIVRTLTADEKQKTALLSILYHDIKLIILDEPTTYFSETKTDSVHKLIKKLKAMGKSIIIITHKLKEAIEISDRITVMKEGRTIANVRSSKTDIKELSSFILGKEPVSGAKYKRIPPGQILLEAKNLTFTKNNTKYLKINFQIRKNEILVVTGIKENGLETLEQILSGKVNRTAGDILYKNKSLEFNKYSLRKTGAGYIPSNRLKTGTSMRSSISDNLILLRYKSLSKWGLFNLKKINSFSSRLIDNYRIKGAGNHKMATLSGGNIQRVMIAREMDAKPELFIFAEPSRGLDIESKRLIYEKIENLKKEGSGILVISSDIDEAIQIADRVLILYKGKEAASLENTNIDKSYIGKLMLGLEN
ncbi:MAG: hypothetical protein DRI73_06260 [Bacteroidetes bacterium]|nr:MAG: hypothetical protein DRI73_06260 [Bacteroidota bacterium]